VDARGAQSLNRLLVWLRRKRVLIPLALFAAYTSFGFLLLPGILRGQIVAGIRKNLKREARLAKVKVNPLQLSITLEGFGLDDPDGTPFVAFDRLFIDYQLSSLPRWAITLRKFRIDAPQIHVRLMPDGKPNFDDLVPREGGKPPRLIVGSFEIHQGLVHVTNRMAPEPEEATVAPIDLILKNFTTIPQKEGLYRIAATDQGGGTWQWSGDLTFEPMHSAGVLEISGTRLRRLWEIAQRRVPFEVTDGRMGCRLDYAVDVKGDSMVARVKDSSLSITSLAVREKGGATDLLKLDSLTVTGVGLRYPENAARIERVLIAGTRIQAWRNADSTLNWQALMAMPGATSDMGGAAATGAGASAARPAAPAPPWDVSLGELAIRDLGLALEDRTIDPPFAVAVAPVNATCRNLSSKPGAVFDVASDVTIAGKGRLEVKGTVAAQPPAADLDLRLADLPLAIFQPYLNSAAKLQLVSGTLGVGGDVKFRMAKDQPDVAFQGDIQSRGFLTRDRIDGEPFLSWKAVDVKSIDFATNRLRVGAVKLTEPYAKLVVHRDRTTNLQDIFGIPTVDSTVAASAPPPEPPKAKGKHGKPPKKAQPKASEALAEMQRSATQMQVMPMRIGTVDVANGSMDFADLSLLLPFAAHIEQLAGAVTGLSSDSASRATVTLDGRMQPSGTAEVRGEINPLAQEIFLDLGVVFHDFNMPGLTPYTGQFLGREVDKGKMSLDLGYRLQGRHLVGKNKVLLDQFELGKKVESPEATHLPVGLAIAILKDKDGKIDLDVPVEGDLDDPKFRIGKVILSFLMSLLKKVATAPFALLGHLLPGGGGGEELSHVDFEPGVGVVPADQVEALGKLAAALSQRPQLRLEVRGRSDADADAAAIRKAKFASLAGEKLASDPKRYGSGAGYPPRLLEDLYVQRFGKAEFAALEDRHRVPAGELEKGDPRYKAGSKKMVVDEIRMGAAIQDTLTRLQTVNDADLLSLANARGSAVRANLAQHGVEEARVFVLDPEPGKEENGRIRVDMALRD
jgi:uncharacterized protein DUF748